MKVLHNLKVVNKLSYIIFFRFHYRSCRFSLENDVVLVDFKINILRGRVRRFRIPRFDLLETRSAR